MNKASQFSVINELKLNDTYSHLKMSYIILNKELSTSERLTINYIFYSWTNNYKGRNETNHQRRSNTYQQCTRGKERVIVNVETQTEGRDNIIKSIKVYKQTKQQHRNWVSSILELLDGRLAVSCGGGAISLNKMNYETKEWKSLAKETKHITMLLLFSED